MRLHYATLKRVQIYNCFYFRQTLFKKKIKYIYFIFFKSFFMAFFAKLKELLYIGIVPITGP